MATSQKKKFKHDDKYDVFPTTDELVREALRAGLSPSEYVRKYLRSMMEGRLWNTASEFVATIVNVRAENTGNNTLTAMIDYEVRSGTQNSEEQTLRIGIISPQPDPKNPNNAAATKAKNLIGQKAKIIKGYYYSQKDDSDYAVLLDIEPFIQ